MIDLNELGDIDLGEIAVTGGDSKMVTVKPVTILSPATNGRSHSTAQNRSVLYFDIETIPDYERFDLFDLEPIPAPAKRCEPQGCPATADLLKMTLDEFKQTLMKINPIDDVLNEIDAAERLGKKPRKGVFDITAELRRQDAARNELIAAQRKTMSLTPEYCRIVAMGWALGDDELTSIVVGERNTEAGVLDVFWSLVKSVKQVCGFNILGFDLPVILVRSVLLDVSPSRSFDMRPWGENVIDLMAKRFPRSGAMGLKKIAKLMGIDIPAGDMDGSKVEETWKADPAKIGEYVCSDIEITRELHRRYSGYFC